MSRWGKWEMEGCSLGVRTARLGADSVGSEGGEMGRGILDALWVFRTSQSQRE